MRSRRRRMTSPGDNRMIRVSILACQIQFIGESTRNVVWGGAGGGANYPSPLHFLAPLPGIVATAPPLAQMLKFRHILMENHVKIGKNNPKSILKWQKSEEKCKEGGCLRLPPKTWRAGNGNCPPWILLIGNNL